MRGKIKNWNNENTQFIVLFLLSILFVYKTPFILNQFFFLVVIYLTYKSKKNYFWIAFFFLLNNAPGNLFVGGTINDAHRMAYFNLFHGISLSINDILFIVMIYKSLNNKVSYNFIFKKDFRFLIIYGIFVLIYSIIVGISGSSFTQALRTLLSWSLLFIVPLLIQKEEDLDNLNRLLFPIVIIAILSQFYSFIVGCNFVDTLRGGIAGTDFLLTDDKENLSRAADSSIILIYCFNNALFYIFSKKNIFSKSYLYIIIFIASFSVLLSATRGWILGYMLIIILTLIFVSKSKILFTKLFFRAIFIFLIVVTLYSKILIQLMNAFDRLMTVESIVKGDATLARLEDRGPKVLSKFHESPVFGWGFSDKYYAFVDKHVGQQTMLLNVGIIGYIIFNVIFLCWCLNIYKISNNKRVESRYNTDSVKIFIFTLLGIYLIHSTSAQGWGFDISVAQLFLYALLLQSVNIIYLNRFK